MYKIIIAGLPIPDIMPPTVEPTYITDITPMPPTLPTPPPFLLDLIHNISAVSINNTSALITWYNVIHDDKFCRIWNEKTKWQLSYTWKLQILEWANWTALYHVTGFKDIKRTEYYSLNESQYRYVELNEEQCTNESYLLTGLSPNAYYKFQIVVEKIEKTHNTLPQVFARNGSHIHYFGKQS